MPKLGNLKSLGATLAGLAPILIALESAPGTVGKVALAAVSVLVAVGLLHTEKPQ